MKQIIRRLNVLAGNHLSADQRKAIKAVVKPVVPLRARRYVRRALKSSPTGGSARRRRISRLNRDVASLSQALWMGFTTDAVADLERIRRSSDMHAEPVARAAETLARWYTTGAEHERALDRVIQVRTFRGANHQRLRVLEHHLLTKLSLFDEAERLFAAWGAASPDLHLMQANLCLQRAQSGCLPREEADRDRLALIDWVFHRQSLVPISELVRPGILEFGALASTSQFAPDSALGTEDPMVSIVVPAYNAAPTLASSVNSLRASTVSSIEILIVDDASTDATRDVGQALAAEDGRVKVFRHEENLGAYGARNTGLAHARGRYFTVFDADDWSHPQRLERQLQPLQTAGAVGTFSRLARVSPQMEFLLRPYRPMLEPIHWSYSSLLISTEGVRRLGGWDPVRAHADSEFIERLRGFYGEDSLVEAEPSVPLSLCLVASTNLTESRGTSMRSVDFGARREYTEQARFWRRLAFAGGEPPSLVGHPRTSAKSPFFAAASLAPTGDRGTQTYDLVLGSDLALTGGTRRCNLAYLECAKRLGLRVGIFNMPRYRMRGMGSIDPAYRKLFQLDGVDLLTPEDDVVAKTLLVHHPPVLRNAFTGYPSIRADRHFLLVNQLPWAMTDGSSVQYDALEVHRRFKEAFDHEPIWIPISPRVRRYLAPQLPPDAVYDVDWYPIVNWEPASAPRSPRLGRVAPVVGRHSRDHEMKWPETRDALETAYLAGTDYEVRHLGGAEGAEKVLGYLPDNWVVHPFDSVSAEEFLSEIDVFVHFHHSTYIEEFGRNIAEAMASGVPCVLPAEYTEIFGDAALYAEPDGVASTVQRLWADPNLYRSQSQRGINFAIEQCSIDVGMRNIEGVVRSVRGGT
jgi:glycosyltransferase involved in cell wall biosynthesis